MFKWWWKNYNLYSYCENNPVNNVDVTENAIVSIIRGAVLGGITSAIMYYLEYLLDMRDFSRVHFIVYVGLDVALCAVGAWVKDIIKVAKLAKLASKLKVSIPLIKKVLNLGVTGIQFAINGSEKNDKKRRIMDCVDKTLIYMRRKKWKKLLIMEF